MAESANHYAPPRQTDEPIVVPASRAVAALLSLWIPGLGVIYAGRVWRGVGWYAAQIVLLVAASWSVGLAPGALALGGILAADVVTRIGSAIDGRQLAHTRHTKHGIGMLLLFAVGLVASGSGAALVIRKVVIQAREMQSGAMSPSLLIGDRFVADMRSYQPKRGDVIVFEFPENREQALAKRIVGMPGETIAMRDGRVHIDGNPVRTCELGKVGQQIAYVEWLDERPHLILRDDFVPPPRKWTVPADRYFVMGDNRNNSRDSRSWDAGRGSSVPSDHLMGPALVIWWRFSPTGISFHHVGADVNDIHLPDHMAHLKGALDACLAQK